MEGEQVVSIENRKKSVPTGVKVIAVLYYLGAVFEILLGLLFLVGAGIIGFASKEISLPEVFGVGFFLIFGIIIFGFGILSFFIGKGLLKAKSWARIVVIAFAGIGIFTSVISMIQGDIISSIFILVIELVIGGYLLFNSDVKEAFMKQ